MEQNATRRVLLIVWLAFLWTVAVYWILMQFLQPRPAEVALLRNIFLMLGAAMGAGVLYLRMVRIGALLARATPVSSEEVAKLRVLYVVCFAVSESLALYGLVLHLLGASRAEVVPFFLAAAILLLVCYPRLPQQGPQQD